MMKKKTVLAFAICGLFHSFPLIAQDYSDSQNKKVVTEREAHYPPGEEQFYTYLFQNLRATEEMKGEVVSGNVMLSFYVEADSTLSDFKVLSGVGYGLDEEVIRWVKPLKYAPAIQNGLVVRSQLIINVPVAIRGD